MFGEFEPLILEGVKKGSIVLVLGAGANFGSKNRKKQQISFANQLSERIAQECGLEYRGENLDDVSTAASEIIGQERLDRILIDEFRYCTPSDSLKKLFNYTWRRLYTWNYDDALEEAVKSSAQRLQFYNGMRDAVETLDQRANLQAIFLHGKITQLDTGIILTKEEYAQKLSDGNHQWYRELASDYRSETVLFIGSSLEEPILESELQRVARPKNRFGGVSFVLTPNKPSPIRKAALAAQKINHIEAGIDDFSDWLAKNFHEPVTPKKIFSESSYFTDDNIALFSQDDVEAAHSLKPHKTADLVDRIALNPEEQLKALGRQFLQGFPVSWEIAASDIPIRLNQTANLKSSIEEALDSSKAIFVTTGQAGSGKSTATMQALLDIQKERNVDLFELEGSVRSIEKAISVLQRVSDRPKLVFLRNLFVFGSQLAEILPQARLANVLFVSTARSGEWYEYFRRYFIADTMTFQFQRFEPSDFPNLIDRLERYVPAPAFRKLSYEKKLEKFKKSKNQLLIALREATESRNFDDIILDEYNSLSNQDTKDLFVLVGLCTFARVGVTGTQVAEAYNLVERDTDFDDAVERLHGIVETTSAGRMVARHEFYVRNILDSAVGIDKIVSSLRLLLETFTKYQIPITKHVTRTDAALFRFLLNHAFIRERAERAGSKDSGVEVYKSFEINFQLDGHFWLQYGLYYQRLGENLKAMEMLEKSIQAFPSNPFAQHALATERLRQAASRPTYDKETGFLVREAVSALERLDSSDELGFDQYPLVTLSRHHIDNLIQHGKHGLAKKTANVV